MCTISARTSLDISLMHSKALTLRAVYMLLPLLHNVGRERQGRILAGIASLVETGELRVHQADRAFAFSEGRRSPPLLRRASGHRQDLTGQRFRANLNTLPGTMRLVAGLFAIQKRKLL